MTGCGKLRPPLPLTPSAVGGSLALVRNGRGIFHHLSVSHDLPIQGGRVGNKEGKDQCLPH